MAPLPIGERRAVADQHLPRIPRLQIEDHQAALIASIGKISVIVQGIDPHIVQGIFRRDHALEIILPDHPIVRQVELDQLRRQALLIDLRQGRVERPQTI